MSINTGQMIGDYEVVDLIESSKTGTIYKVRNVLLQRFEALRVMPRTFQDDQEKVTRFLREAKLHALMHHPNIVSFYHATQLDGQLVMTTELVEGTTLAQRLELGPLPLEEALSFFSQVLSGLGHAHVLGVVHRDIVPANIILTSDGQVKLTGFALAKAATDPQLTQPGTVMGSLNYISPEQVKGLSEIDKRSDIYSLGVVLYEAVTGRKPFQHQSQFEVMLAHVNEAPLAPSAVNTSLPAELDSIVLKAMAKDAASRFQTAEEFRAQLDILRGVPQAAETPVAAHAPLPMVPLISEAQAASAGASEARETPDDEFPMERPESRWNSWSLVAAGLFTFLVAVWAFLLVFKRP